MIWLGSFSLAKRLAKNHRRLCRDAEWGCPARVEHGAVVQGCEAKEEVGWIGDGGRVSQLDQVDKHRTQGNLFAYWVQKWSVLEGSIIWGMWSQTKAREPRRQWLYFQYTPIWWGIQWAYSPHLSLLQGIKHTSLKKEAHDSKLGVADSYLCWTGEPVSQWELWLVPASRLEHWSAWRAPATPTPCAKTTTKQIKVDFNPLLEAVLYPVSVGGKAALGNGHVGMKVKPVQPFSSCFLFNKLFCLRLRPSSSSLHPSLYFFLLGSPISPPPTPGLTGSTSPRWLKQLENNI